jgi:hypothetical protein
MFICNIPGVMDFFVMILAVSRIINYRSLES